MQGSPLAAMRSSGGFAPSRAQTISSALWASKAHAAAPSKKANNFFLFFWPV